MILSFSKKFPWGEPTNFEEKILSGTKNHSIREDPHRRWREGMKIHFATGVRTPNYNQFHEDVCTGVQEIEIKHHSHVISGGSFEIFINGFLIPWGTAVDLIESDGFDGVEDFLKWFDKPFKGRLIHWTDLRY